MNYFQCAKSHRIVTGLLLAVPALTVAGAAIPAQAQTYKVVYNFGSHTNDPITPGAGPNFYCARTRWQLVQHELARRKRWQGCGLQGHPLRKTDCAGQLCNQQR